MELGSEHELSMELASEHELLIELSCELWFVQLAWCRILRLEGFL